MATPQCPFEKLLIVDFETTCEGNYFDYAYEIIQFSVVVLDVQTNTIDKEGSFNKYVRPVINKKLTEFCSNLTGIAQETVDAAETFPQVYNHFIRWLMAKNFTQQMFAIVCDSRQDMWKIAQYQFKLIRSPMPPFFRQYVNLWTAFKVEQDRSGHKELMENSNVGKMNEYYGLEMTGPAHNALNDCLAIANIVQKMLETGANITINEALVCHVGWRRNPLEYASNWREDFKEACHVFERIMPLVAIPIRPGQYRPSDYGVCVSCRGGVNECGKWHRQYPSSIYVNEREPVVFARTASYY